MNRLIRTLIVILQLVRGTCRGTSLEQVVRACQAIMWLTGARKRQSFGRLVLSATETLASTRCATLATNRAALWRRGGRSFRNPR
jgi:hypothetical protein